MGRDTMLKEWRNKIIKMREIGKGQKTLLEALNFIRMVRSQITLLEVLYFIVMLRSQITLLERYIWL